MMKLFSQLLAVDSATPLPRKLDGNTSEGIAQGLETVKIEEDQKKPPRGSLTLDPTKPRS